MGTRRTIAVGVSIALLWTQVVLGGEAPDGKDLAHQIFETMLQAPGVKPGFRLQHARGIVCRGSFAASPEAAKLSKAAHFQAASVPVRVRFSNAAQDPTIPDNSPNAGPRGMAIRFMLPGGGETDIVAISHNGFLVGNGEEFLALVKAVVATDPGKPHPWPIEQFLGSHPVAMKFLQESAVIPESFVTESYFGNNAFTFVNAEGAKQPGRYKIIPVAGEHRLSDQEAKGKAADFLIDELKARLPKEPAKFRLIAQLPNPGDPTNDSSLVWPDDRKTVDLGVITIAEVVEDNAAAERALAFDPTNLTEGIELSDDSLPELRSSVYALSVKHRRQK